jgi:hypothetical protein
MRLHLNIAVFALAATWLASSFLPPGIVVCAQSSGNVEIGLSCPCESCQSICADETRASLDGCCSPTVPVTGIGQRCCSCAKLPPLLITVQQRIDPPCVSEVVGFNLKPLACLPQPLAGCACIDLTRANPPPLLMKSVVLLV